MPSKNTKLSSIKTKPVRAKKVPKAQNKPISTPKASGVTLKHLRAHVVNRATNILRLIPKVIKFYQKLSPLQIAAIKYYKGPGSFFQSELLADYNTNKGKQRELSFPFPKNNDKMFYRDILGKKKMEAIYDLELPAATNFTKYIEQSYGKRIAILNDLDTVYDHKDCPKLIGNELLFRGMTAIPAIKKLKVGDTYTFKNFISTTIDRQVAEQYAQGNTVFVLTGLKDIPFIYMPNGKLRDDREYIQFLKDNTLIDDLSEITLPRNLEFEITSVEKRHLHPGWRKTNESGTVSKLLATLKRRGLANEKEAVEEGMFPKGLFIFAKLKTWHPREPIDFAKIRDESKFVLDEWALSTWKGKDEEDD